MTRMPPAALLLGLAGLIPFVWGALTQLSPGLQLWGSTTLGPRYVGPYIGLSYGIVILSFMSGVLWGFSTKADGRAAAAGYALSVLPALWAFFMVSGGPVPAATNLMIGFAALLLVDFTFWKAALAPGWWMQLRVGLTAIVLLSLAVTLF